jgi:hypothetical protein
MKIVRFSLEQGNRYFGEIDGARFFIGRRVSYQGGKGLTNVTGTTEQKYDRSQFKATHGFWADFIHPTAIAEGGFYHTLNTYDRARFTFSFLQYAAHVPNGDFVVFLRSLLALPLAVEYFPDLRLENGRISRIEDDRTVPLESDQTTEGLMDYLNPSLREIEDTEVIQSAKFVHWAQNDPGHRQVQVDLGINHFKSKMETYARQYGLDGKRDTVCLVVADIRHQGRAKSSTILTALEDDDPLNALLELGEPIYHQRLVVLRQEINRLAEEKSLGQHVYSLSHKEFVSG